MTSPRSLTLISGLAAFVAGCAAPHGTAPTLGSVGAAAMMAQPGDNSYLNACTSGWLRDLYPDPANEKQFLERDRVRDYLGREVTANDRVLLLEYGHSDRPYYYATLVVNDRFMKGVQEGMPTPVDVSHAEVAKWLMGATNPTLSRAVLVQKGAMDAVCYFLSIRTHGRVVRFGYSGLEPTPDGSLELWLVTSMMKLDEM